MRGVQVRVWGRLQHCEGSWIFRDAVRDESSSPNKSIAQAPCLWLHDVVCQQVSEACVSSIHFPSNRDLSHLSKCSSPTHLQSVPHWRVVIRFLGRVWTCKIQPKHYNNSNRKRYSGINVIPGSIAIDVPSPIVILDSGILRPPETYWHQRRGRHHTYPNCHRWRVKRSYGTLTRGCGCHPLTESFSSFGWTLSSMNLLSERRNLKLMHRRATNEVPAPGPAE
jgi:hypothetical protein